MHIVLEFAKIISTILVWEFFKSQRGQDFVAYLFFVALFLSLPPVMILLTVIGAAALLFKAMAVVGFIVTLLVIGLTFAVTNGYGQKF